MSQECVFCRKIQAGGDEYGQVVKLAFGVACFEPLNPVTPGHMLFVPREHLGSASSAPATTAWVMEAACRWAAVQHEDFNLITSAGPLATQTVNHLHIHYVPRRAGDGLALPWTTEAGQ